MKSLAILERRFVVGTIANRHPQDFNPDALLRFLQKRAKFVIKSEAMKSGVTNRTATLVLVSAALISVSHCEPGTICLSDQLLMEPARRYGFRCFSRSSRHFVSSGLSRACYQYTAATWNRLSRRAPYACLADWLGTHQPDWGLHLARQPPRLSRSI